MFYIQWPHLHVHNLSDLFKTILIGIFSVYMDMKIKRSDYTV